MSFQGLSSIGQINIPVHELNHSIEFYRDILGIKFIFQVPGMAFFDCGGLRLLLTVPEDRAFDHPSSIIYFMVDDIHSATEALTDRGVSFSKQPHLIAEMPDHDLWMSFFKDPNDNTLALMAETTNPDLGEKFRP